MQVDDQMKLLQNSWSEMLILDQIHQRMHNHLPDETTLPNGQKYAVINFNYTPRITELRKFLCIILRGSVKFVPAVTYHFCLNLPATFSQPRTKKFSQLCILRGGSRK